MRLSERMRDVLRAVAKGDVCSDGIQRYHGHVNITLRALERRGLIYRLPDAGPRITDEGRVELARMGGSTS